MSIHVTAWLQTNNPDVLLLQELKGAEFPSEVFKALGCESTAVTQKTYNGVAILSPIFVELPSSFPRLYLASGVTTARTTGSVEPYTDMELKRDVDAGRVPGPKLELTGPYLEGAPSGFQQMHGLSGADEAREFVRYGIRLGSLR